jgi:transposase
VTPVEYTELDRDALIQGMVERDHEIAKLRTIIASANRAKHGPKTETLSSTQYPLSFELPPVAAPLSTEEKQVVAHTRKIARGRKPLPDSLEREEIVYLPEETHCPCCNEELVKIGEYRTEELEKIPAQLKVIEHIRPRLACARCKEAGVVVAKLPPSVVPVDGARPGAGLLADIAVSKYVDHLPLHRQEQMFQRQGIELSRKRMCDWIGYITDLVMPLHEELKKEILRHSVLQADETTLKIQDGATPGKCHTGYLWGLLGPPNKIWYHYAPGRAGDIPKELLKEYRGVVQTDAYAGYNPVFVPDGVKRIACLAHVRRKFIEVEKTAGKVVADILQRIAKIYHLEGTAKNPEELLEIRQKHTQEMCAELIKTLQAHAARALPRSPVMKALTYALNQKEEIARIFESGEHALDNNAIERQMKQVAIGRKNYYFAGSHEGAKRAAVLYSLFGTCRLNSVNPWKWLRDVLMRISDPQGGSVTDLLPYNWKSTPVE